MDGLREAVQSVKGDLMGRGAEKNLPRHQIEGLRVSPQMG